MSPRTYRLQRRAETAEETRARIVSATLALHSERGVESVEDHLVRMSDHDTGHLRQLHQLT